jgi:hypothetical protein
MIRDYCTCGAMIRIHEPNPETEQATFDDWQARHVGPGHASCDANTSSNARWRGRTKPPPV